MKEAKTCRHCNLPLVLKQTKRTPDQLKKQYYYTAYFFCNRCGRIYFDNKFKNVNDNQDLFSDASSVNKSELEAFDVEIWTDGACVNNGQVNAKAAWAFVSGKKEGRGLVEGAQTNNRAEAYAIYEALKWASVKGYKRIKIYADTLITLQGLKKPLEKIKANREIFQKIFAVIKEYNLEVIYEKVLGHSGVEQNERVDKLANSLANK